MKHSNRLLAALCAALPTLAPAGTEPFTAEAMWALQRLGEPALSPDGATVVVPVTRFDVTENEGDTDLYAIPVAGGPAEPLTTGEASESEPAFSPDGRWLAFVAKRGEDEEAQLYVLPLRGGEARRITEVPTGVSAIRWFPDSRQLAFVTRVWPDLVKWEDQGARLEERGESKMTAKVWEKAPIAHWDRYLDDREPHLYSIAIDGGEPVAITRGSGYWLSKNEYSWRSYDLSPDGQEVTFVADTDRTGIASNNDLIVTATCGCKPARNLTPDSPADDESPLYSPDGRSLAFTQQRIRGFYADRARLMLHDRTTGTTRGLTEEWDRSAGDLAWSPDSKSLVGAIDDAATYRLYRFDVKGGAPRALTTTPSFTAPRLAGRSLIALRQSFSEPPVVVRIDPRSGEATKLSTFNDAALDRLALGRVESVTYKGARDADIQMWVIYPPDFDSAKRWPAYMLLHGGPHNGIADAVQWRWNAHVFASWGYVVTWHNFHGSSGFGQEFTDSINPDRISLPYEDTVRAADWLKSQPWIDGERLAAGGGSYGGFLAATLLGRPHPFRALVAHAAVYNSFTQYGADYAAEEARFFHFWERPEEFARYSPHTNAGEFRTPTLVIHGQNDLRVPVNHGVELFNVLQIQGVPSKLVYYPDENHWILKPQNSLFWYRTVREWLAAHAAPGPR
jgi:dipeptidyl aminopeptidase/acylaminoacyl peptidase